MAIYKPKTWPWAGRHTFGTLSYKNLYSHTVGYTDTSNEVNAANATAIMAATNGATTVTTVTDGLTDPDVPRALSVTPGGTSADILDSHVTVTGTNVEGKTISEKFNTASGSTTVINGSLAFRTITRVVIGQMGGSGATFSVGTQNKLGVNHKLWLNNTTVKVYSRTIPYGALTLQGAPTVVASDTIERNLVTPATTPDNTTAYIIMYTYDNWSDGTTLNDQPEYSTTTSTSSTSSSTSTTTVTTSTSSTSISTSSTSISTSSTSISTSSTSTSTTTTP